VEAHGGAITAESPLSPATAALLAASDAGGTMLGPGTCLTVTLPV
jgi:signal transduction histidine kinase